MTATDDLRHKNELLRLKLEIAELRNELATLSECHPPAPTTKSFKFGFEWTT